MTPTYLNSSPALFPYDLKEDQHHQLLLNNTPNPNSSSSSSSPLSCHIFFNSCSRDHKDQQEGDHHFATNGGSYEIENESDHSGLKFSIWKQEIRNENESETSTTTTTTTTTNIHQVKWMSSKMRLMHKMKTPNQAVVNAPTTTTLKVEDDQKHPSSSSLENDNSSINTSNSSSNNSPIRVCSDCNTTKTPLWRSGPRGPKSLCNACGIRQRKARRAMAAVAAAATTNGTIFPTEKSTVKINKVQHKDKRSNSGQKRCKLAVAPPPPSQGREKLCFEDFLISLSKNLAFHRVFPQDEKDAAILLMALSCGHVHG